MTNMTDPTAPEAMGSDAMLYQLENFSTVEREQMDPRAVAALGILSVQAMMIRMGAHQAATNLGDNLVVALQHEIDKDAIAAEAARIEYYANLEDRARRDDDATVTNLDSKRKKSAYSWMTADQESVAA